MNAPAAPRPPRIRAFTLIELIGVLAIIAILAAVLTPNMLTSIDRAAVRGEYESLHRLGDQVALYLRENGDLPGQGTIPAPLSPPVRAWAQELAVFSDLGAYDIDANPRRQLRMFYLDAFPNPQRALLVSKMRNDAALTLPTPTAQNTLNAAVFDEIWLTPDGEPPAAPYAWGGWAAWQNHGEALVIERINLAAIYATDLQQQTFVLKNEGTQPANYAIYHADGTLDAQGPIAVSAMLVLSPPNGLLPRQRLDLFLPTGVLNYSHVVNDRGRTFVYKDATGWQPEP